MNQYAFKVTIFNETKQRMEFFNGINPLKSIFAELTKIEQSKSYRVVEFHARKLTPNAKKI